MAHSKPALRAVPGGKEVRSRVSHRPEDSESRAPISEYMIPAADTQGHSARIISRVPPNMKHQLVTIVQSGKYPWKTDSELIRWCVYWGLERLSRETRDPGQKSLQAVLSALVTAAKYQQEHLSFQSVLDEVTKTLDSLNARGAQAPARALIAEVERNIEEMDDPYWRDRYRKALAVRKKGLKG